MAATPQQPPEPGIAKNNLVPYYAQLSSILKRAIVTGAFAPGELLPSESELCATYGLSRTAVRQALGLLALEGLVRREKGRGTFVSRGEQPRLVVHEVTSLEEELQAQGRQLQTRLLSVARTQAPPDVAADLGLRSRDRVAQVERLHHADGEPFCLSRWLLPLPRFASVLTAGTDEAAVGRALAAQPASTAGTRRVSAVRADDDAARHLQVEAGSPVLQVSCIDLDAQGQPLRATLSRYAADRAGLHVRVAP